MLPLITAFCFMKHSLLYFSLTQQCLFELVVNYKIIDVMLFNHFYKNAMDLTTKYALLTI